MQTVFEFLQQPFAWGLAIGLALFGVSLFNQFKTKGEFRRYRKMLSDKMELEAEMVTKTKAELERISKENENLRLKLGQMGEKPHVKLERELEILARAERQMMINAPGFAPAWETAKAAAADEVEEESAGKSLPKRLFRKFLGRGSVSEAEAEALPEPEEARS